MARQKRPVQRRPSATDKLVHKRHPSCESPGDALLRRLKGLMNYVEKSRNSECFVGVKIGDEPCWRVSFDTEANVWHEQLTKRTMSKVEMRRTVLEACDGRDVNLVLCNASFMFFEGPHFHSPLDATGRKVGGEGSGV